MVNDDDSVAKDSSSPLVLKLTLHSLTMYWEPDLNVITEHHSVHSNTDTSTALPSRLSLTQLIGTDSELCLLLLSYMLVHCVVII